MHHFCPLIVPLGRLPVPSFRAMPHMDSFAQCEYTRGVGFFLRTRQWGDETDLWKVACWCWSKDTNWSGIPAYIQYTRTNGTYTIIYYFPKEQGRILNIEYCYYRFTKQSLVVFITTHINVDFRLVLAPHQHSGSLFVGSVAAMNKMEPFQQLLLVIGSQWVENEI